MHRIVPPVLVTVSYRRPPVSQCRHCSGCAEGLTEQTQARRGHNWIWTGMALLHRTLVANQTYPTPFLLHATLGRFQSSPALSSGRYRGVRLLSIPSLCFNPRPPFRADATMTVAGIGLKRDVSILARPFERTLLIVVCAITVANMFQSSPALSSGRYDSSGWMSRVGFCFNPRPPFRADATKVLPILRSRSLVSILARPFERTLHRA